MENIALMERQTQYPAASQNLSPTRAGGVYRIGSVSFLNAKPLIWGLDRSDDIRMKLDVPSRLHRGLEAGTFDLALLPVIDYQEIENLRIVPAGGIGCDGETLTVRIFSKKPVEQIRTLACDTDSHTSVALARVIFAERYALRPEFVDWHREEEQLCDARLLIGDKVVCDEPPGFEHQIDLGSAWKKLTGLPFVFACWTARGGIDLADLPQRLLEARTRGLEKAADIVKTHAVPRGWPAGLAMQYLTMYLKYDIGPKQLEAIRLFHSLAAKHNAAPADVKPLVLYA